jgi:hypothetical protein
MIDDGNLARAHIVFFGSTLLEFPVGVSIEFEFLGCLMQQYYFYSWKDCTNVALRDLYHVLWFSMEKKYLLR